MKYYSKKIGYEISYPYWKIMYREKGKPHSQIRNWSWNHGSAAGAKAGARRLRRLYPEFVFWHVKAPDDDEDSRAGIGDDE